MTQNLKARKNHLVEKSTIFAVKIVRKIGEFPKSPAGFALGDQLVRSGTSIGANVQEAQRARSKKDFKNCLQIALKEASESRYWLYVAQKAGLIKSADNLEVELEEIIKIIYASVATMRK